MTFSEALEEMRKGHKINLPEWNSGIVIDRYFELKEGIIIAHGDMMPQYLNCIPVHLILNNDWEIAP